MARPLTGGLRFQRGTWWASIPDKTAASGRRYESFLAEDDARAWLAQAVTALQANLPLPDAERFRTRKPTSRPKSAPPKPAKIQPDIASVANAWMNAAYEDLRRGGPDRAERVRRIIDGYLAYLDSDELVEQLADNPFTPVDLPGLVGSTLNSLARQLA